MLETGSISFATAFVAGVISFLSPCVLPLVPGYLSYVAGTSLESLRDRPGLAAAGARLCRLLRARLLGRCSWPSAPAPRALGGLLLSWRYELGIVAGVVVLLFGLHMAGLLPIASAGARGALPRRHQGRPGRRRLPARPRLRLRLDALHRPGPGRDPDHERLSADLATGTALLAVYSLGLGLPFLLAALFTDVLLERLRQLWRTGRRLQRVAGLLLAVVGRADDHRPARGVGLLAARDLPGSGPDRLSRSRFRFERPAANGAISSPASIPRVRREGLSTMAYPARILASRRPGVAVRATDEGLRSYMLSVYNYMGLGLAITGLVAFLVGSTPALYVPIFTSPLKWVVMLAPLGFVFFLGARIQSMSTSAAQITFWAFAAVMGLSMASIFLVFTGESIARVFFITAATFGAVSLYGYTTKRDLTGMGSFLFMGLIGIVIASLVNIFLASSTRCSSRSA